RTAGKPQDAPGGLAKQDWENWACQYSAILARSLARRAFRAWLSSPVPEILIVTEAAAPRGFRTVRIAIKWGSARNTVANRAAALRGIGSRGVGSRIAGGPIGLCVGALHPSAHSENADTDQGVLHRSFPSQVTA